MGIKPEYVKNIVRDFKITLAGLYPQKEIMSILYFLFEEYINWPKSEVHMAFDRQLEPPVAERFRAALVMLCKGKPVQYILHKAFFNELTLKVTPDVLIPRPETEELSRFIQSDNIQDQYLDFSILDIGTGSGCIAIDLKKKFPYSKVTGIDNSERALSIAEENAQHTGLAIRLIHSDILNPEGWERLGYYDLIVSNPPYIREHEKKVMHRNVVMFEPSGALFVPDDKPLLYYEAIGRFAAEHLIRPGNLYVEINESFGKEVMSVFSGLGFTKIELIQDLSGKDRFVKALAKPVIRETSYWYADKP
ncbi:MAG: peptide chain release factor N(5)-glutamine methyltransferase [Bacteroidales bacterium]|nr:peptide chain release factor N(5)-glutamine methyltransferase [Bacteroidales bacterium]